MTPVWAATRLDGKVVEMLVLVLVLALVLLLLQIFSFQWIVIARLLHHRIHRQSSLTHVYGVCFDMPRWSHLDIVLVGLHTAVRL